MDEEFENYEPLLERLRGVPKASWTRQDYEDEHAAVQQRCC